MASQIITTDNLIDEVRSLLDEDNRDSVSDSEDILPALNRAQNYAANILSRHYDSPMLETVTITPVGGQSLYDIPEDAFEERIEKVEVKVGNVYYPVDRINWRDTSMFEYSGQTGALPEKYAVIGGRIQLYPSVNASYPLRLWYLADVPQLVKSMGRITDVNEAGNYVYVDEIGEDLTTSETSYDSYVNIIDAQSGRRKASLQINNLSNGTNRIDFKSVAKRGTVLNTPIDTSLAAASLLQNADSSRPSVSVNPDDFVCVVRGSCVPFFKKPFTNFLIQYAVAEIRGKLNGSQAEERAILKDLERQVELSWAGREQSIRVKSSNRNWGRPWRRFFNIVKR